LASPKNVVQNDEELAAHPLAHVRPGKVAHLDVLVWEHLVPPDRNYQGAPPDPSRLGVIRGVRSLRQRFALARKPLKHGLLVIPFVAALGLAFIITSPSPQTFRQNGRISVCAVSIVGNSPTQAFCPSERPAIGQKISFEEAKLFGRTFRAYTNNDGVFVVSLPAGHYRVSVESCRDYRTKALYPLEMTVSSAGWPGWNPPALYWVVDNAGGCWSVPPIGL